MDGTFVLPDSYVFRGILCFVTSSRYIRTSVKVPEESSNSVFSPILSFEGQKGISQKKVFEKVDDDEYQFEDCSDVISQLTRLYDIWRS